ncbi:MAG: VWA domain-containing protein [Tissierellia bacterium]|nr:VWA domain-containing protein [Tissierellia bacterium]
MVTKDPTNKRASAHCKEKKKDLLSLDFYDATYLTPLDDIYMMESLIPLLAKKISSKIVIKKKRHQRGQMDYRQTIRTSLKTGGIPIDIRVKKKYREKPVIFALCDVSRSCLYFSFFSLAIVHMLEKFFREVRSFAFIEKVDEITTLVKEASYEELRPRIMANAEVTGSTGYTNYGNTLATFYDQYGHELSYKSTVIIFGDARNNWFDSNHDILEKIFKRVKKVYWFNPESKDEWQTGDSDMILYQKYCTRVFVCSNLNQLADAICEL